MLVHTWSGNVRELKGTVRSAVLFTEGDMITADKLEFEETPLPGEASLSLKSEEAEKKQKRHSKAMRTWSQTRLSESFFKWPGNAIIFLFKVDKSNF